MYRPKAFQQSEHEAIVTFIAEHPLAVLVCPTEEELEANHLPLYMLDNEDQLLLRGHVASANSVWKSVANRAEVLVIFQGPQSYISPNWYPSKHLDGKAVPTWNYTAVYIKGKITFIEDHAWKLDMLDNLSSRAERFEQPPWQLSDAPEGYIEKQLNAIVGLEITVTSIKGTWKLSQNHTATNQAGVLEGLKYSKHFGAKDLLAFMQKVKKG